MKPKAGSLREGWPGRWALGGDGVATVQTRARLGQGRRWGRPQAVQGQENVRACACACVESGCDFSCTF